MRGKTLHPAIGILVVLIGLPIVAAVGARLFLWWFAWFVWCLRIVGGVTE